MRKILAIDGGGIKGVFPASLLATVEDSIEGQIADYFDLVVGTSTGGIIALALGLGFSSQDILNFYEDLGPKVFKGNKLILALKRFLGTKYDKEPLEAALESEFGERKLGESKVRLVIPSLNLETGEVYIYKTAHHPRLEHDYQEKVVDIALATASAPTYFPAHRSANGVPLIDGGTWANNPVGLGVVEAIGVLEWSSKSIKVLSLGCTTEPLKPEEGSLLSNGLLHWAYKIVNVFQSAQSSHSIGIAQVLLDRDRVVRINPKVSPGRFKLDSTSNLQSLKGLGFSEARKNLPKIKQAFLGETVEAFEPHYDVEGNVGQPSDNI